MGVFIGWVLLSFIAGYIAEQRGRSGIGFFFLALVLSPLIGIVFALVVRNLKEEEKQQALESGTRMCPFCAERIKKEAIVCKHCGRDVPAITPALPATAHSPIEPGERFEPRW